MIEGAKFAWILCNFQVYIFLSLKNYSEKFM